jgi:asparagine synthase (glutamine-hydrolysing)
VAGIFGTDVPLDEARRRAVERGLAPRGGGEACWYEAAGAQFCFRPSSSGGGAWFDEESGDLVLWEGLFADQRYGTHSEESAEAAAGRLLASWREEGAAAFRSLNGSFALVLAGPSVGGVVWARDAAGSKPLYWVPLGGGWAFASTCRALTWSGLAARELDPAAVAGFVSFVAVPDPLTIYRDIRMVRAGGYVRCDGDGASEGTHWSIRDVAPGDLSSAAWAARLRAALERAVDVHGRGDPTPGFFLSGGHDTTAVVGLASRLALGPVRTLTIGFGGQAEGFERFNEYQYAAEVAREFGTEHHEATIDESSVREQLARLVWHLDQPSGDAINSYLVSGAARTLFRSVLTGTGGDELFVGSHWFLQYFRLEHFAARWAAIPAPLRRVLLLLPLGRRMHRRFARLEGVMRGMARKYAHLKLVLKLDELEGYLAEPLRGARPEPLEIIEAYLEGLTDRAELQQLMALFLQHEVTNLQLRDLDVMAFAQGIEARSPLVDRAVMDVVFALPEELLAPEGRLREMMNRALDDLIPQVTRTRPKMSFIVPMEIWARTSLKDVIMGLLSRESVERRGHFRWPAVARLLDDFYVTGRERHPFKIWNLAVLELWERLHVDRRLEEPPDEPIEAFL